MFVNVDDTNDNTPEFEPREYTFWVWEEHSGGTRLGRVTVSTPQYMVSTHCYISGQILLHM